MSNLTNEDNKLVYDNIWESIFPDNPEKAKDFETLAQLAIKYDNEVQLFFGTREEFKKLEGNR